MNIPPELLAKLDELSYREITAVLLSKIELLSEELKQVRNMQDRFLSADDQKVYKPKEIADLLKVHSNTVYRYLTEGALEYIPGTKYRCTGKHIKDFFNRQQEQIGLKTWDYDRRA